MRYARLQAEFPSPAPTAASQQQRGESDQIHHPNLPDPVADHCSSLGLRRMRPAEISARQRGHAASVKNELVENRYESLLLLPFCGDCQGFPASWRLIRTKFRQANKGYLPWTKQNHAV
jgi:hypothetical protein